MANQVLKEIDIDRLVRGRFQPRQQFDESALQELADAIKTTNGLLQPIVVRAIENDCYEIIAGERRWRAAMLAGFSTVSCLIKICSDIEAMEAALIENISRQDLNPIEEANAYQRLLDDFGYTHEQIAERVGKSRAKITNTLRMQKLDTRVQQFLIKGELSEGHGKILVGLPIKIQYDLAIRSIKNGWSVRRIEQEVKKLLSQDIVVAEEKDTNIKSLERALSEHVGCQVEIDVEENQGQLKINFHNLAVLEGLFSKMGFDLNKL